MKQILSTIAAVFLAMLVSLSPAAANPEMNGPIRVLMVISGHGKDGGKTAPGYEFEEFAAAYLVFEANGIDVDVASPNGGKVESDPYDPRDAVNAQVLANKAIMTKLENSMPIANANHEDYDAVFVVGGKGAMFDLPDNGALQDILAGAYTSGGIVAAVCHGPAALVNVQLPDGSYLVDGKQVNGFTNVEEHMFGKKWMPDFPFLLEDKLVERGGEFQSSPMMLSHVAIDGRLITGQNPASTPLAAEAVVRSLGLEPVDRPIENTERTYALIKTVLSQGAAATKAYEEAPGNYNGPLISMYGFFLARSAKDPRDHHTAIAMMDLDTPVRDRPQLRMQSAKSWAALGQTDKAREIVQALVEANPENEAAKAFAASLN